MSNIKKNQHCFTNNQLSRDLYKLGLTTDLEYAYNQYGDLIITSDDIEHPWVPAYHWSDLLTKVNSDLLMIETKIMFEVIANDSKWQSWLQEQVNELLDRQAYAQFCKDIKAGALNALSDVINPNYQQDEARTVVYSALDQLLKRHRTYLV